MQNRSRWVVIEKKFIGLTFLFLLFSVAVSFARQDSETIAESQQLLQLQIPVITDSTLNSAGVIFFGDYPGWRYSPDDSTDFLRADYDDSHWMEMGPTELSLDEHINNNGYLKGWFRLKFQLDSTLTNQALFLRIGTWGAAEVYIDGVLEGSYGKVS